MAGVVGLAHWWVLMIKPVLKNVDLRWRRNSKRFCSFMLQDTHSQALLWEQLGWTQGKAASPVSSLITLIVSRKNIENLLRILSLAFLYITCFYDSTACSPTSHCNIFLLHLLVSLVLGNYDAFLIHQFKLAWIISTYLIIVSQSFKQRWWEWI